MKKKTASEKVIKQRIDLSLICLIYPTIHRCGSESIGVIRVIDLIGD
jgi:hypothetical protein